MTADTQPAITEAGSGAAAVDPGEGSAGQAPRRALRRLKAAGVAYLLVTACLFVAAYEFGEGHVWIDGRTISDMTLLEVTGASAVGTAGLIAGLGAAALALLAALVATVASLAVAVVVGGFGVFFALGVLTGPVLLAVMVGVLIKRRYYPDVI